MHVSLRVAVFLAPGEDVTALVNPTLELLSEDRVEGWEACLSVPGLRGVVPRSPRVRYAGTAPDGTPVERVVDGLHAVVVQHEFDHLDGILYPQRMTDLSRLIFDSEARWFRPADDEASA